LISKLNAHFQSLVVQMEARIRSGDRDNLNRYAEANKLLPAPTAKRRTVLWRFDHGFWR